MKIKKMRVQNSVTFNFVFLMLALVSVTCSKRCAGTFKEFHSKKDAPFIHVAAKKENCNYSINVDLWIDSLRYTCTGEMVADNDALYLVIDSLGSGRIRYFDFEAKEGELYEIELSPIGLNGKKFVSMARIDEAVDLGDDRVFLFRVLNGFWYVGRRDDVVYIVSRRDGVVGSYVSSKFEGKEIVAVVRGDILKNRIDYSKKIFGVLQ